MHQDVRCGDLGATTMETASLDMMVAGVQQREKEESLRVKGSQVYSLTALVQPDIAPAW